MSLARKYQHLGLQPRRIVATDMLDLPVFMGLLAKSLHAIPIDLYMHENQLLYPSSASDRGPDSKADHHFAFSNWLSCLAADRVFFNSGWHRRAFLDALPGFLSGFPDHREAAEVKVLRRKSKTLYLGLDLQSLSLEPIVPKAKGRKPLLLWNHRWEYDKNPALFFDTLRQISATHSFKLVVIGQDMGDREGVFAAARRDLHQHIIHWGMVESRREYATWLQRADILPLCSEQDFFGASVVEALYAGCRPVLPNKRMYPEHLGPISEKHRFLYEDAEQFLPALLRAFSEFEDYDPEPVRAHLGRYDWSVMAGVYDRIFSEPRP